jgi:hypothetical protein
MNEFKIEATAEALEQEAKRRRAEEKAHAKAQAQANREEAQSARDKAKAAEEAAKAKAKATKANAKTAEEAAKMKANADRAAEKAETEANLYQAAVEFITENKMYFVAKQNKYVVQVGSEWIFLPPPAMYKHYPLFSLDDFEGALIAAMADHHRNFLDCTYGITVPAHKLNLLDTSQWVQPIAGESHWVFDVLMRSLGGDKPDNIAHLERVTYYHYEHPGCCTLPCIVIGGEGGTGKNLFMDCVLKTLYAGATISTTASNIVGHFNSLLKGCMAAMINESQATRLSTVALKDLLHKPTLYVNEKGIAQYEAQNLATFIIGCNFETMGGVMLDRSKADRRLSVLFCERGKDLLYWLEQETGWSREQAFDWITTEGVRICADPIEVGKWLYGLQQKYAGMAQPQALHAADFIDLMEKQKGLYERMFEAVFNDPEFTHIEPKVLFAGYIALAREEGGNRGFTIGRTTFYERAEEWLLLHKPAIKKQIVHTDSNHKRAVYMDSQMLPSAHFKLDNADKYIAGIGPHALWHGPDLHY